MNIQQVDLYHTILIKNEDKSAENVRVACRVLPGGVDVWRGGNQPGLHHGLGEAARHVLPAARPGHLRRHHNGPGPNQQRHHHPATPHARLPDR